MTMTMQEVWCPGCVPGECVYGPCAKPVVPVAGNGLTWDGASGLGDSNPQGPPLKQAPNMVMDAWRFNTLEEVLFHLAHFEDVSLTIRLTPGSTEPWAVRYSSYGAQVFGRDLREVLDYTITMLRETVAQYEGEGRDEEEDDDYEEDPEPF